jgi:hypothetical protein
MARVLSSWDEGKPGALAAMQASRDEAAGTAPAQAPVEAVEPAETEEVAEATEAEEEAVVEAVEEEAVAEESEADAEE